MKLKFDVHGQNKSQPDPFIFEDNGKFYLYVTAYAGVEAYSADAIEGEWKYEGIVLTIEGKTGYWAPCIIRYQDSYYIYTSCTEGEKFEYLHVARSDNPLGPFTDAKCLFDRFTIDAHVVETAAGLFLWYAEDNEEPEKIGTRVFVDKLIDPYTPANIRKEVIVPDFEEELFRRKRPDKGGRDWYTIEGAFWFTEGDWQYVMYSGGCYENDTYHIGYAAAKSAEADLTKVDYVKYTDNGRFAPVLIRNEYEEGTGHHSVIRHNGKYYAIYHGRDIDSVDRTGYEERRTARICELEVKDGRIKALRL